jgi:hypothetical protein
MVGMIFGGLILLMGLFSLFTGAMATTKVLLDAD